MDINLLILCFTAGGLLLLSFLMLSNAVRVNRKPNFISEYVYSSGQAFLGRFVIGDLLQNQIVYIITRFIQFFSPTNFLSECSFYSNPYYKYRVRDTGHLILAFLFLILLCSRPVINTGNSILYTFYSGSGECIILYRVILSENLKTQKKYRIFCFQ